GGPPIAALSCVHATKLLREDSSMLVRNALVLAIGAAVGAGYARDARDLARVALAVTTIPLVVLAASIAVRVVASEARMAWLLDAHGVARSTRAGAALSVVAIPCALEGGAAGATVDLGIGALACAAWGASIGAISLAIASGARVRRDPSRIVGFG